jgi:HNH endonuclease
MAEKAKSLSREEFDSRVWPRILKAGPDECWVWGGGFADTGYGTISSGRRPDGNYTRLYVHREVYRHRIGPIPDGLFVMHKCDNRRCANPAHLTVGSQRQNLQDMVQKRRHRFGERHHNTGLTDDDVREIRRLYAEGWTMTAIAAKKHISRPGVSLIVRRINWKYLD